MRWSVGNASVSKHRDELIPATFEGLYSSSHLCRRRWTGRWLPLYLSKCTPAWDPSNASPKSGPALLHSPAQPSPPALTAKRPQSLHANSRHPGVTYHLQAVRRGQAMTSLQGTETKIKLPFNSSVVNYSYCLWLEDIRANKKNLWVQWQVRVRQGRVWCLEQQ